VVVLLWKLKGLPPKKILLIDSSTVKYLFNVIRHRFRTSESRTGAN
jgi:hypothetical protein